MPLLRTPLVVRGALVPIAKIEIDAVVGCTSGTCAQTQISDSANRFTLSPRNSRFIIVIFPPPPPPPFFSHPWQWLKNNDNYKPAVA